MTQAIAPGKAIITGEHAVVYGQPALVMAVNRHATVTFDDACNGDFAFAIPALAREQRLSSRELVALRQRSDARYQQFLAGDIAIDQVLDDPFELLPYAWSRATAGHEAKVHGGQVAVAMSLPIGAGMGSSAALALATLRAGYDVACKVADPNALYDDAMACEQLQHGKPSGVDPCICLHGGTMRFQDGQRQTVAIASTPFTLVMTGQPTASTGACVMHVREHTGDDQALWAAFGQCCDEIQQALQDDSRPGLIAAMRENHRLLVRIGVVPEHVQAFVRDLESTGGAAKISGAGSIRGDAAGAVLATGDEVTTLCQRYGFEAMNIAGDQDGVRIV